MVDRMSGDGERSEHNATGQVPDLDLGGPVFDGKGVPAPAARGEGPSVGAEGHGGDLSRMPAERAGRAAGGQVPDHDLARVLAVAGGRGEETIVRAERHAPDREV